MQNKSETDERQYLEMIRHKMQNDLEAINTKISNYAKEIREQKAYIWENKTGMDHVEKISIRQAVDQSVLTAEAVRDKGKRIQKLLPSPYFGRVDFIYEGQSEQLPIYIGIHAFFDEEGNKSLIHDWRAPISTMFYDFETGQAHFESPSGTVSGEIILKRQYRIRNGQMEFMLESDISIHDDILQKELSCASDDRLKNIVATIQRDQNAIIRNENSQVLIIQGVAGSGKTSIALHRIAFLLYRFKDTMTSKDLLILSPNKVFADYISNILPELGEETIPEIGIEELARELLKNKCLFQTFFEQVSYLIEKKDNSFRDRIQAKASLDFINKLNDYIAYAIDNYFLPTDLKVSKCLIPSWFMEERFKSYKNMPIYDRLDKLVKDIEQNIGIYYHYDITADERNTLKISVRKMFKFTTLRGFYKNFYTWQGKPKLCKLIKGSIYEYSDVFPLIYLKMHCTKTKPFDDVKHLLIDEMQDYTPIQYAVISKLFGCKKTILGDANQSVNPFSSSSWEGIKQVFPQADAVKLCKSYRSTYEITQFAQKISPNIDLEPIERHGKEPHIQSFQSETEEIKSLQKLASDFMSNNFHSMGIICKSQRLAERFFEIFKREDFKCYLLSMKSDAFRQGIVICSAHMAKGLEFDHVIVPNATSENYATNMDKSMLYIACTRAMHELTLTASSSVTSFIQ